MRVFENDPDGKEGSVRIAYLSVMNRDGVLVGKAMAEADVPVHVKVACADSETIDSDERSFVSFMEAVAEADVFFVRLHGDHYWYRKFDRMMEVVEKNGVDMLYDGTLPETDAEYRDYFRHGDSDYRLVRSFLGLGGKTNHDSLMKWVCREILGMDVPVPEPVLGRTEGIFVQGFEEDPDPKEFFKTLDREKPTVGVMFHATTLAKETTAPVEELIASVRRHGANVIPVFFVSSPDKITGSIGVEATIRKYMVEGGRFLPDSVIMAAGFSQINMNSQGRDASEEAYNFFEEFDVPIIQAGSIHRSVEKWEKDIIGMTQPEIGVNVIWPEYDGQVISVPHTFSHIGEDGRITAIGVRDRTERIASLAVSWAELRRKPASDRKVAVILNMYPPTNDRVGGAAGLDTFESIRNCLIAMKEAGYKVDRIPSCGNEVVDEVLAGLTSDMEWVPEDEIEGRAMDFMTIDEYRVWYDAVPEKAREGMVRSWGDPPGPISVHDGKFIIPGVMNGNVFIGTQPNRGQHDQAETLYHDPRVVMPHQYLAFYRWLKYEFEADCVVHMGTHGTLEWLPGKGNGLSSSCYPDVILDTMPNVYPYIINDPGEGMQCKRRTNSVLIAYMTPAMTRAGGYEELGELDANLQEYLNSKRSLQEEKRKMLALEIRRAVGNLEMYKELGIDPECGEEEFEKGIDKIYDYVADIKDALIKDGLHILGKVPDDERLKEMVYSLCRLRNGSVPSLRGAVATAMGLDLDALLDSPSAFHEEKGVTYGTLLDRVDGGFEDLIREMHAVSYDLERSLGAATSMFGKVPGDMEMSIGYVCDHIHPSIMRITDEMRYFLQGNAGGYVPPGPSGSPTRGNAHLLPTGKNCYSIDPDAIPSSASWEIGKKMADGMIERYVEDNGAYPESVGIVLWATDTMKTGGDDIAYILYLMGMRPIWGSAGGRVVGTEVIPIDELGRPRIDVTVRISGMFRDSFPALSDMLVEAADTVAGLDESEEDNFYKKHLREDVAEMIKGGMSPAEAVEMAGIRVFGDPPGQHGNGVSVLIESSKWDTIDQIAETYATWGSYAYGGKWKGEKVPVAFKRRMATMEVTVKNHNDREFDLLDIDDDYDSLGGMNAAVRVFGGKTPYSFMGDSSDPDRLKARTLEEETAYVMRSRVLNPIWVEGLKEHGYRGAMELAKLAEYMLGWSATSDSIEDWMFQAVTEKMVFDEETRHWVNENNPAAMKEMIEDLLEAIDRGLWDADEETKRELEELYLEYEGLMEDAGGKRVASG
ncbi:MAG: cobaltochelatase subunit CobN [Thermoplasmatales archaeon]|nr:cobaltochelatase subunit CobN [Thermoplasmatales archaeon]